MRSDIGEVLRDCRKSSKFTQQELAYRLHVDRSVVSRIETGEIQPSYLIVKTWAKVTNSTDIVAMEFSGVENWNKLRSYKENIEKIKEIVSVSFMRIKKVKELKR